MEYVSRFEWKEISKWERGYKWRNREAKNVKTNWLSKLFFSLFLLFLFVYFFYHLFAKYIF